MSAAPVLETPAPGMGGLWRRLALAIGPGLVVMLADTDAGSVITASQTGAQWGYRLVLPQLLAIPLLYAAQEITIRLGAGSGAGLAELIARRYGRPAALAALALLLASCFGALVTQLGAVGGLAQSLGLPAAGAVVATVAFLIGVVTLGVYASVERVAILAGLFEIAFLAVAWRSHPDVGAMGRAVFDAPLRDSGFLYLLAANIGTTFMPWAAFYQQSAMVDKGLDARHIGGARLETLLGAALCQIVTAAIIVAGAATAAREGDAGFATVGDISRSFAAALGPSTGNLLFAAGLLGSALVAAIVVSLAIAWAVGEVFGLKHSLEHHPREAPVFYAAFVALLVGAGAFVASGVDPVRISIGAGVVNALLLPLVFALLLALARTELTGELRLGRGHFWGLAAMFAAVSGLALYSGLVGAAS